MVVVAAELELLRRISREVKPFSPIAAGRRKFTS
jgi:hypothetical protein